MNEEEYLKYILDLMKVNYEDRQIADLLTFYELMVEKNKVMNLTGITEFRDAVIKHFADSLYVMKFASFQSGMRVIDIGTGAGFPGVPLAVFYRDTEFLLIDSVNKKLEFIQDACDQLNLSNVRVCHVRAEDLAHDKGYREQFDFALSRAVSNLSTLAECSLPFVKVGGYFISYKSKSVAKEAREAKNSIRINGGGLKRQEKFILPDSDHGRELLFIKKVERTPVKYPRKAGVPFSKPL